MMRLISVMAIVPVLLTSGQTMAETYQISPIEDTWTYMYDPDTAYGPGDGLATDMQYMSPRAYTYLKFTLPDLSGETVESATLYLYQFNGGGYGEGPTKLFHFSNNTWSESTLTWNSAPTGTYTALVENSDGHSHRGWSTWSFAWDPGYGNTFTLYLGESSSGDQSHNWHSKECTDAGLRPYLEIETISDFVLTNPTNGSEVSSPPTFQWSAGPYDAFASFFYFYYPGYGYYLYPPKGKPFLWLTDTSLVMPVAWWNKLASGKTHYWAVLGYNTSTQAWEVVGPWSFKKK